MENQESIKLPYDYYSVLSKNLAKQHTEKELQKIINECEGVTKKYAKQHLAAIEKSTSMQGNSQRRAQTRNNVVGNYEKKIAYICALEIHQYYPEKCI